MERYTEFKLFSRGVMFSTLNRILNRKSTSTNVPRDSLEDFDSRYTFQ